MAQGTSVRQYTVKDGLPFSYVYGVDQDKLGYLWISSPEGLSRFDGKHFTSYGLSDGLPDTRVGGMFEDTRLRYWVATRKKVVEFKGNKFISYPFSDSENIRWVFKIVETKDSAIWCLTNAGVYEFKLNKWQKIKLYPGYDNHTCRSVLETKDGLYINYGDLLVLKKPDTGFAIIGAPKSLDYYYNYLLESEGEIFISTPGGVFEIKNQHLIRIPGVMGKLKGLYGYFRDSKKRFWVEREDVGLQVLKPDDSNYFTTVYGHPKNIIFHNISEDKQGNIWVGSGSGLFMISDLGFKVFQTPVENGKGRLCNLFQSPGGPLLMNNGSMTLKTFENGVIREKKLQLKGNTPLPNNELIIDGYAFDNKNRCWYYLRGFSLAVQVSNDIYVQNRKLSHLGNEVFDVLFDQYRKKIIVAVRTQKYPCQFNDTSYSPLNISNNIEIKGTIRHLQQCANGTILFSTDRSLVYSIDKQNVCRLQLNEFADAEIRRFYNDPSGDVWIIYTGRGLRRYTWQNDSLFFKEQLTKDNGLSTDNVTSMSFDDKNNLWVCSNSDVAVFSEKKKTSDNLSHQMIDFFGAADLQIKNAVDSRLIKDKKGRIWFFSDKHLICFYPDRINYNVPVPAIEIEKIELNLGQTNWIRYADSLQGIFQLPVNPHLSYENNTLGIYFKGISSSGTDGIKYAYVLEGLQNRWSDPSSNDFVSFVKIPPGKYHFKVKAQLYNTNWSKPAVFSFEIDRAFWQARWFYILMSTLIVAGVFILFRFRLRQKINLLEMRNRISRDLHDEIGASISGINLLSQMAVEKLHNNKADEASEYLVKVKDYTQDVIEKLSDMVWLFNAQNDSIEKLLQRLKSFTISIASLKNVKIHFLTDKETEMINLTIRQRKAIYLISKEAFNNAFKYAASSNIYYSLQARGSKCRLRIQDDGLGFVEQENTSGNGLINMRSRSVEIGANFDIQSQPGSGTTITVEF